MKKRRFRNIVCSLAIIGTVGGFCGVAKAGTVSLYVDVSNIPGANISSDPYSPIEKKGRWGGQILYHTDKLNE